MNCEDAKNLIHAYADGELELLKSLELDQHLKSCSVCAQIFSNHHALCSALKGESLYLKPHRDLQSRIHSALRKADKSERKLRNAIPWSWLNTGAALALVAVLAWTVVPLLSTRSVDDMVEKEIVANHVRSLLANHLTDVASSDQHTVKPWFNGKLDFSPPVEDFAQQGFPLTGARLDYLENKTVAALVYRYRKHYINLFIWPADDEAVTAAKVLSRQGYHIIHWTQSGMRFWAVSELNKDELQEFVRLVQRSSNNRM